MHSIDKRKKLLKGIILGIVLFVGAYIIWIINYSDSQIPTVENALEPVGSEKTGIDFQLLVQDKLLQERLNELYKLDKAYTILLTDTSCKKEMTELNAKIAAAEAAFKISIDSIAQRESTFSTGSEETFFINRITAFRELLQNRQSIEIMRNTINKEKAFLLPGSAVTINLKNELIARDNKIGRLEYELAIMSKGKYNHSASNLDTPIPAVNTLKEKNSEQENKISSLIMTNIALQKKYDRLLKESNADDLDANDGWNKKRISLENKIEDLNIELSLAKVDCNLTRTDAGQIISNSKQRKQLLSEALSILNNLSNSDNLMLQKKIQDKITRLNQVARNYRD